MRKNDLIKTADSIYRVLSVSGDKVLAVDCLHKAMPAYSELNGTQISENDLLVATNMKLRSFEDLTPNERKVAIERYTIIAGILTVLDEPRKRIMLMDSSAKQFGISKQTIRNYLYDYLVFQNIAVFAPKQRAEKQLSADERNMRWALNKFFYTRNQNSLQSAFAMMLKEKYCDGFGQLFPEHPTFNQFRYFYRKTRKMENFLISRNGIKDYQKNDRPLLGEGVQAFAPTIGTAMLDGTICDIYLVDDSGQLVGRPILVVACDANSSLCLGYSLLWEGGTYSLQKLMLNIIEDKVSLCERFGIQIVKEQWNVNRLPSVMVTDGGSEYTGQTFSQIAELGVSLVKLPSFRAELKGTVEKLFDLVQSSYKDILKGKGVIMPDFQERGSHDYRLDACLTMDEFEKIILRCIVHYNSERVIENYPTTEEMLDDGVPPYASEIWNYKLKTESASLISVSKRDLALTLLPRTNGKFTRFGLRVNKLRYHVDGYKEQYLSGGDAVVTYNPDDVSKVWLKEKDGSFAEFSLIESRFANMPLSEVASIQTMHKKIVQSELEQNYQAKIDLMNFIEGVSSGKQPADTSTKDIRQARTAEKRKRHRNIGGEIDG